MSSLHLIPSSILERGMLVLLSIMVLIAKMVTMARTVMIAMTSLTLLDRLGKVWLFQKTFCWLTLAWYFTFSNADIQFARKKLVWMTYTAAKDHVGGTLQSERTCGCSPRGLWLNLVVQVSSIQDSILDKNVPIIVPVKYADHTDISSSDSTMELPECISINEYTIGLVDKLLPYDLWSHMLVLQYCSSARKTIAFNCMFEILVI